MNQIPTHPECINVLYSENPNFRYPSDVDLDDLQIVESKVILRSSLKPLKTKEQNSTSSFFLITSLKTCFNMPQLCR